jgi:hypothetical protein
MFRLNDFALRLGVIAASILLSAAPGSAADKEERPSTSSRQVVPEAASPGSGSSGELLSEKLRRQDGVLRPPTGIDPEMTQKPPPEGKTPIIRPPGTPGDEQGVDPK